MKKIYHLGNCTTCQRILKEIKADKKGFDFQEIKTESITAPQLDALKKMAGSYEALFSRRALKYKEWGLKDKALTGKRLSRPDIERIYFSQKPVIVNGKKIFIGSEKKTVNAIKDDLK